MSDIKLQSLKRQAATGDLEARVRLLRERVRAGERSGLRCEECGGAGRPWAGSLVRFRSPCESCDGTGYRPLRDGIELAAYLGDERARVSVSWLCVECRANLDEAGLHKVKVMPCSGHNLTSWLKGLIRWGQETLVRAAVAAAREALGAWETRCEEAPSGGGRLWHQGHGPRQIDVRPLRAIEVVEAYIVDSSEENQRAWKALWKALMTGDMPTFVPCPEGGNLDRTSWSWSLSIEAAAHLTSESRVRSAIQRELVPWALGEGDIVKERKE